MKHNIEIELGELNVEVSVTEDNNGVLMEFEAGTELEGAIDLTDELILANVQVLIDILQHALARGRIAREAKSTPQEKLSELKPQGGIHGSREPLGTLGEDPQDFREGAGSRPL